MKHGKIITCRECDMDFQWYHGKPGHIFLCPACVVDDVAIPLAEMGSDDTGVVETITTSRVAISYLNRVVSREV